MMMSPMKLAAMTALLAAGAGTVATAQTSLLRVDGGAGGSLGFGIEAVSNIMDVTGDGVPELVVGDPPAMQVRIVNGATGATIDTITEVGASTLFGWSVAGGPDMFNAGQPTVLVGDPGANRVRLYELNNDGTLSGTIIDDASVTGNYGWSVAFTNDVDLDGVPDILGGAPAASSNGVNSGGGVWRSTGNLARMRVIDDGEIGSGLGYSVDGLSDIDEDGQAELLMSPITGPAVRVYSGATVFCYDAETMMPCAEPIDLATLGSITLTSLTGLAAKSAGDIDNDGLEDIVVGNVFSEEAELPGSFTRIYAGTAELSLLREVQETNSGSFFFGSAVNTAGDVDADGFVDFVTGSFLNNFARVYSGEEGAPLVTWRGDGFKEGFGFSVGPAGDNNMDGTDDVIVGCQQDYVKVLSGLDPEDGLFLTGTRLDGEIVAPTVTLIDDDQAAFFGLKGMEFRVRVKIPGGSNARLRVRVIDALGMAIADWTFKNKSAPQKRSVTLKSNQIHRLEVTSLGGTLGTYRIRTSAGFPTKAKTSKETESGKALGGLIEAEFLAVPGSTFKAKLKPVKGFPAFPSAQLVQPNGSALVLIPYTEAQKPKTTVLKGVPLSQLGVHKLVIYGAEQANSAVQLLLKPNQATDTVIKPID